MINPPELPNDHARNDAYISSTQVCGCFSAHPPLPHQKAKRETSDALKSQLNQAS